MLPSQLQIENFKSYPPQARQLATDRIELLQQLPLSFVPLLLREIISYDWKFPAERSDMDRQLAYLGALAPAQRDQMMAPFARLKLSSQLERLDWVDSPGQFSEQLTAHLWATRQIDGFREAAEGYIQKVDSASPAEPPPVPRLGVAVIGKGVAENKYPLFRKFRPYGVYFSRVKPENGLGMLLEALGARAAAHPVPFGHWYIDGGTKENTGIGQLTCVAYNSLDSVRTNLLNKIERAIQSDIGGPEALRTMMARLRPDELGLSDAPESAVLNHFQVSVLTEGSGTQIFSTTFVQWTAREALRRAQPITLLTRYAPRQRQRPMNELLSGKKQNIELDPPGSLIDADMGAFYTWLNQQRLRGAAQSSFLVWFEDHSEALAISPTLPRGTQSDSPVDMKGLLAQIV
ncbi:MAG TPA: hypothetical protein VG028_00500 [Terriglobia bacterium]|nr:hypothetical protein [Terriglobia bacterium]